MSALMVALSSVRGTAIAAEPPPDHGWLRMYWHPYLIGAIGGSVVEEFSIWMTAQYGPTWPHWMPQPVIERHWRQFLYLWSRR